MSGCLSAPSLVRICLALLLLGAARLVAAHPAPFSYLDLYLYAERTRGTLVIHDFDAAHELQIGRPELLREPEVAAGYRDALVALIEGRLRLEADDADVKLIWGPLEVLAARQSLRLPFTLE